MATPRVYDFYQDGFLFACPGCESEIAVGVDRLEKNPTFECYQCGQAVTIEHAQEMVDRHREASAAMQRLHEAIDRRREPTKAIVMGAEISRTWWED